MLCKLGSKTFILKRYTKISINEKLTKKLKVNKINFVNITKTNWFGSILKQCFSSFVLKDANDLSHNITSFIHYYLGTYPNSHPP